MSTVKGLDAFSKRFLTDNAQADSVVAQKGWTADQKLKEKYAETRETDFVNRAGSFTLDLIAFFKEQQTKRRLSDIESIFAIALATINLREAYGSPQSQEEAKAFTAEKREELLRTFDEIAWGAQQYYDANK